MFGSKQEDRYAVVLKPSGEAMKVKHPEGDGIEPFFVLVGATYDDGRAQVTNAAIIAGGGGLPGMTDGNVVMLVSRTAMLDGLKGEATVALNDAATLLTGYPVFGTVAVFTTTSTGSWAGCTEEMAKDLGNMARGLREFSGQNGTLLRPSGDLGELTLEERETMDMVQDRMRFCLSRRSVERALDMLTSKDPQYRTEDAPTPDAINKRCDDAKGGE